MNLRHSSRPCFWKTTALLAAILCWSRPLVGQNPPDNPLRSVQRIDVPDQQPQNWPDRHLNWVPRERSEFERLLSRWKAAAEMSAETEWQSVRYTAALSGNTLSGGRFVAELQRSPRELRFLPLGTPSIAIEELAWDDRPAVWGTDLEGRHWLQLESGRHEATGRWTARGRTIESGMVFDLDLLSAAISELTLITPRGHRVVTDVGDVSSAPIDDNLTQWRIYLGAQSRFRLMISHQEEAWNGPPAILYEQDLAVEISQEELQLLATLRLEILEGEARELTVSLPRHVEIDSVMYGDKPVETSLKWERLPGDGPISQLRVTLPEPIRERSRPVRLEGFQRRVSGEPLTLPQFTLEGGVWLDGRLNVNVLLPLEIRSSRPTGYRQDSAVSFTGANASAEGESISFQQLTPRAQLVLNLDRPTPERIAHALSVLTVDGDVWTLSTEIAWESRAGTVFQAACRFPDDWQIVSVVQLSGGPSRRELVGWKVQPHPESGQMVLLDFPDGLTPGRVEPIGVVARRVVESRAAPKSLPLLLPMDCESSSVLLAVPGEVQELFSPADWGAFERFDVETAAPVWNTLPSWGNAQTLATPPHALLHLSAAGPTLFSPAADRSEGIATAQAHIELTLGVERVEERWQIRIDALPADRRLELYFPNTAEGSDWTYGAGQPLPSSAVRVQPTSVSSRRLPSDGELWTMTVPPLDAGEPFVLTGTRRRNRTDRTQIPLVFIPQAVQFRGRVSIHSEMAEPQELLEQPWNAIVGKPADREMAQRRQEISPESDLDWEYRTWDREWVVLRGSQQVPSDRRAIFKLESVLSADAQGYDYHKLKLTLRDRSSSGDLRIRLDRPAEFIAILRDDQRVPFAASGSELVVAAPIGRNEWDVGLLYRVPVRQGLLRAEHRLVLPKFDWQCAGFNWSLCVPPRTVISREPLGLQLAPEIERRHWFQRLWGPLARRSGERVFLPFASWINGPPLPSGDLQRTELSAGPKVTPGFEFPEGWPVCRAVDVSPPDQELFECWSQNSVEASAWFIALLLFPLGIFLRWRAENWRVLTAAVLLSAVASFAIFGPEPWSDLSGGACLGLAFALLMPKSLLRFWPMAPQPQPMAMVGSTATFQQQAVSLGLLLSWGWVCSLGMADDGSNAGAGGLRVLVPVDATGQPSPSMPLVFLSPSLADELRKVEQAESRDPEQLIHAVDYMVYADRTHRSAMRVKYQIECFSQDQPTVLRVPVGEDWMKGLDSCLVDGRPQQPTRAGDQPILLVDVPRTETADEPTTAGRRHEIVLEVRLLGGLEEQREKLVLDTFPALNSRLSWQIPARVPYLDVPEARGAVSISADRRLLEAQLGAVQRVGMIWGKDERSLIRAARTELKLSQLLTLRPSVALSTFRIACRVLEGAPESLELRLPPGGVLRDVRCHKLLRTISRQQTDGSVTAIVEFTEPQQQEFVVEGDLVFARLSEDAPMEAPRLGIHCGNESDATLSRSHLAIACGPEFEVKLVNPDDPGVLPITLEQFVSNWGDTVPTQRPQAAFQLQEGGRPAFRLTTRTMEQQVLSWHEDVRLSGRQLHWRLTADVKPTELPSFTQTLLLDRRLKIESASVLENGVERQRRWSVTPSINFSQNRLVLDLNRQPTGTFQIRIEAGMPIRLSSSIALPVVSFEDSRTVPGTLSLFHDAAVRVELEGRSVATEELASVPAPVADGISWKYLRTLPISEGETGLFVRLEPTIGRCRVQHGLSGALSGGSWPLSGWLRLEPEEGAREIRVLIPEWLDDGRFSDEDNNFLPKEFDESGHRILSVAGDAQGTPRVLRWEREIPASRESEWNLNLPLVEQATSVEAFVCLPTDSEWIVDRSETPSPESVSSEVQALLPPEAWSPDMSLHVLPDSRVHLVRIDQLSPDGRTSVLLVDHRLSGAEDGGWRGETDFYPSAAAGAIDFLLPDNLEIIGILVGERLLARSEWEQSSGRVRVLQAGQHLVMSLLWRLSDKTPKFSIARSESLGLPRCVQQRPPTTLVSITAPPNQWLLNVVGIDSVDPLESRFERLEVLTRRYSRQKSAGAVEAGLKEIIREQYRRAATQIADRVRRSRMTIENKQRWEAITEFVNHLKPENELPTRNPQLTESAFPANQEMTATWQGRLTTDAAQVGFWQVAERPFRWAAAVLFLVLAGGIFYRSLSWWIGPWIDQHYHTAWFVFGFVWWLCWSPSIVGFALMAGILFRSLWRRRSPPEMALG